MIVKKPYAFLIKYFRIIHLLLFLPIVYLIIKTRNIVAFFRDYVANNYTTNILNIVNQYISLPMYLAVILIIVSAVAIFYLMKQKNKSTKLYVFTIGYYIILFLLIVVAHNILGNMERDVITAQTARAYRDISQVIVLPQYFFAVYMLIRGIGFDIKQFNFANDLKDLEISEEDREEVELSINVEGYKIKRTIHRFFREFSYYVQENKLIFSCILVVLFLVVGRMIYVNYFVNNRTYIISDKMTHQNFSMEISDSIVTNLDYDGNLIVPGKYFLVLKLDIENTYNRDYVLDYNNFRLVINNKNVYPTLDRGHHFVDFGKAYQGQKIKANSSDSYVLVYEIDEKDLSNSYTVKILDGIIYGENSVSSQYKTLKLRPRLINKINERDSIELGKIITMNSSSLGYSTLEIKDAYLSPSYTYEYEKCVANSSCQTVKEKITPDLNTAPSKTLLVLKAVFNRDNNSYYYKANRNFFNDFVSVRYTKDNVTKILDVKDLTTRNMQDSFVLELNKEIEQADSMELLITIRHVRYVVKIK